MGVWGIPEIMPIRCLYLCCFRDPGVLFMCLYLFIFPQDEADFFSVFLWVLFKDNTLYYEMIKCVVSRGCADSMSMCRFPGFCPDITVLVDWA